MGTRLAGTGLGFVWLCLLALLGGGAPARAAVGDAFLDAVASGKTAANASSLTVSHTVANNANRFLIVAVAIGDDVASLTTSGASVRYGGVPLSFLGRSGLGTTSMVELWGLVAPAVGTANVVVTLQGAPAITSSIGLVSASYFNVSQVNPTGIFVGNSGTSTAPTVTVSGPETPREIRFGVVSWAAASANLTASGVQQTPLIVAPLTAVGDGSQQFTANDMSSTVLAGPDNNTMTWTLSASAVWRTGMVSIKPFTTTENANQANVGLDTTGGVATAVSANSLTLTNFTVNNNANRGLAVFVAVGDNNTGTGVASVTYGGNGLAFLGQAGGGTTRKVEIWGALAPAVGTANIVATLSGGAVGSIGISAVSLFNIDQTNPINVLVTANATSAAPSVTLAPPASSRQLIIDVVACNSTQRLAVSGANQTPHLAAPLTAQADNPLQFTSSSRPQFGNTVSWTMSGSAEWVHAAVSINAAPIAAASNPVTIGTDTSVSSVGPPNGNVNSRTLALTVGNNTDRLLVVGVAVGAGLLPLTVSAATVASVTYGGVAMTFAGRQIDNQSLRMTEIWTMVAPPVGTNNIVATLSAGTTGSIALVGASFFNVNQTASVGAYVGANGNNTAATVDVAAPETSREVIFNVVDSSVTGTNFTIGANQNALAPGATGQATTLGTNNLRFSASTLDHDASNTSSWTVGNGRWTIGALALRPFKAVPTAVRYLRAHAVQLADRVSIYWTTALEKDNVGFRVWRRTSAGNTLVTPDLIAGAGLFVTSRRMARGRTYHADDPGTAQAGAAYFVEDLDMSGRKTWYGPLPVETALTPAALGAPSPSLKQISDSGRARRRARRAGPVGEPGAPDPGSTTQPWPSAQAGLAMKVAPFLLTAGSRTGPGQQSRIAASAAVKIRVNAPGWYQVSRDELVARGLPLSVDPAKLALYVDGHPVALTVRTAEHRRFASGDAIEFFGTGQDTPTTDRKTYWLLWDDDDGRRVRSADATHRGTVATPASFPFASERRDRSFYVLNVHNGDAENFFGPAVLGSSVDQILALPKPDTTAAQATVTVSLQGLAGQHAVAVALNGHPLGVMVFTADNRASMTYPVPGNWLVNGDNTVRLTGSSDQDVTVVESIRVDYAHRFAADDGSLLFSSRGGAPQTVTGFTSANIRLLDVTEPAAPVELFGRVSTGAGGYAISFTPPGTGTRTLLAFAAERLAIPVELEANRPSSLRAATNGAAVLLLTHHRFAAALEPLRARRAAQYGSAMIVDVEDVYDEFNAGDKSTDAIRDFLRVAAGWRVPPRFVLLVGDATFDPRNYALDGLDGDLDFDFVPTRIVDTTEMETASDDWYTDTNGDGAADVPIGRLPVRTEAQAAAIVAKILAYEDGPADPAFSQRAIVLSDVADGLLDFAKAADITATVFPAGYDVKRISADVLGTGPARAQLLADLDAGASLAVYFGHSTEDAWGESGYYSGADAEVLNAQTRQPVLVSMTCLTGFFQDLFVECLAKRSLRAPAGPIAIWASTGFVDPSAQPGLGRNFVAALTTSRLTLGEAAVAAKRGITDRALRATWTLFGDPAMHLR